MTAACPLLRLSVVVTAALALLIAAAVSAGAQIAVPPELRLPDAIGAPAAPVRHEPMLPDSQPWIGLAPPYKPAEPRLAAQSSGGTAMQAASVVPARPGYPTVGAVAIGVPGEIGVPVGAGEDGPVQVASMVPARSDHPVMLAVAPLGETGVPETPLGVEADGRPEQAASWVPMRPGHPVMLAGAPLGEPGLPDAPEADTRRAVLVVTVIVPPPPPTLQAVPRFASAPRLPKPPIAMRPAAAFIVIWVTRAE